MSTTNFRTIKITIPSLSDFKDVEEESKQTRFKRKPSEKSSSFIESLPPPNSAVIATKVNSMVPHTLTKKPVEKKIPVPQKAIIEVKKPIAEISSKTSALSSLCNYSSDSEDEQDENKESSSGIDFFSLSSPRNISDKTVSTITNVNEEVENNILKTENECYYENTEIVEKTESNKTLVSNVMNLPKEEILLKNKAEIGPKLPVPEQEYNVDSEGNVAFDEKAIEYLCGKRGIKRKNELDNINIVEINGEDIKPDERDWLIKALTEEPIQRPISIGAGPSGQSKKKHQITYLAHQAKAMELELKNQWAQNKANRQQTRSKYGF